jgi:hypothetical protein
MNNRKKIMALSYKECTIPIVRKSIKLASRLNRLKSCDVELTLCSEFQGGHRAWIQFLG